MDSTLIGHSGWPRVAPFGGPNGGVIRSDPSQPKPRYLRAVEIARPIALCEGTPIAFTAFARFQDGSVSNVVPDWAASPLFLLSTNLTTNVVITAGAVAADTLAPLTATLSFSGSSVQANSNRLVLDRCFHFRSVTRQGTSLRMELRGPPSELITIEQADSLTPPINWQPVGVVAASPTGVGTFITNLTGTVRQRFFRPRHP